MEKKKKNKDKKGVMDYSYIAGFFDGEGSIKINFIKKAIAYQVLVRIYSTEKKILEKIREFVGYGHIYTKTSKNENCRIVYEFSISKKAECLSFLKNIFNFSILKKQQIEYLLQNFNFGRNSNKYFDIDKFVGFIKRKNQEKHRKYHTIKNEKKRFRKISI